MTGTDTDVGHFCRRTSIVSLRGRLRIWPLQPEGVDGGILFREMALHIGFLNEAHRSSSRPVAYLKGARLERDVGS